MLHFIHNSLTECYHTYYFNILLNGVVNLDRLSGAWYCISWPAKGCSSYTHILSRYKGSSNTWLGSSAVQHECKLKGGGIRLCEIFLLKVSTSLYLFLNYFLNIPKIFFKAPVQLLFYDKTLIWTGSFRLLGQPVKTYLTDLEGSALFSQIMNILSFKLYHWELN